MTTVNRNYPLTRMRRLRSSNLSQVVAESKLSIDDLILPIFVIEGNTAESVEAMPGISRFGLEPLLKHLDLVVTLGITTIALFPCIDSAKKDALGSEALQSNNMLSRYVKAIKLRFPQLVTIADVALDPYNLSGHDGIVKDGKIINDETVEVLTKMSLQLAAAGFDVLAPSDMMDGRILAIRQELEKNKFFDTIIMSYAAKYNSVLYTPFRYALKTVTKSGSIDKSSYQLQVNNSDEAMHECALDINEGADCLIIKPAMFNADIIYRCSSEFKVPTFAYQVSGEYAMIKALAKSSAVAENTLILESLTCLKRAGACGIWTYFAIETARLIKQKAI